MKDYCRYSIWSDVDECGIDNASNKKDAITRAKALEKLYGPMTVVNEKRGEIVYETKQRSKS